MAGTRKLDSGMGSILRDMRNLLRFSEERLEEARDTISILGEKMNKVTLTLRVFKGLIEAVKKKEQEQGLSFQDMIEIILENVENGPCWRQDTGYFRYSCGTNGVTGSQLGGLTRLTTGIIKAVTRPEIEPKLGRALSTFNGAITIVKMQKESMENDLELIIVWKDAVALVKLDVFGGNLKERTEREDQDLHEEIEEIIEGGDVEEIYDSFNGLKNAAAGYLQHVKTVCPTCSEE